MASENKKLRFDEAEDACEELGGALASVLTEAEYDFIFEFSLSQTDNNELWIGGRFERGILSWVDGSFVADWGFPYKDRPSSSECLLMNLRNSNAQQTGLWEDFRCTRRRYTRAI